MDTNEMETTMRRLEERVEDRFKVASDRLRSAGAEVADFVKEHPGASLAGAFVVGYLIARAARQ